MIGVVYVDDLLGVVVTLFNDGFFARLDALEYF